MKQIFCFIGRMVDDRTWSIEDQELYHLERVLRLKSGDQVQLIDGQGNYAAGTISTISKLSASVEIQTTKLQPESRFPTTVAVGALRHGSMDEVLPAIVELGVGAIVVFRPAGAEKDRINEKTLDRWQRIVVSACKQSKRARLPELAVFDSLDSFLDSRGQDTLYFFDELADSSQQIQLSSTGNSTGLIVGNEAGLGAHERLLLQNKGIKGVRFGNFIMRATTAVIAAATLLEHARTEQNS